MKTLIVEDEFTSRLLLQHILAPYGECHTAVTGKEGVYAFHVALEAGQPYDLVCLDIKMPEMDGHKALQEMRAMEAAKGILPPNGTKIVMTTAVASEKNVVAAYREHCDGYLIKPIDKAKLLALLEQLKVLKQEG
jgi:two-component system, chemotaxis family, chemotaxis protein CheY